MKALTPAERVRRTAVPGITLPAPAPPAPPPQANGQTDSGRNQASGLNRKPDRSQTADQRV